ncbi:hypothetical protein LY28_03763, partial [Ruminiclostridium sufflavum DSM 19573]
MDTDIQSIIDYIDSWRSENGLAEGKTLTHEQTAKLAVDVQNKIGQLSFEAPTKGANIIPYSGQIGDTYAYQLAKASSQSSSGTLCYISDIQAGEILISTEFRISLQRAVGNIDIANNLIDGSKVNGVRTAYGIDNILAYNDFVSKNAMLTNAHGNVITYTGGATLDINTNASSNVWALTELPTLLEMSKVTSIDGIPKEQLLSLKDSLINGKYSESQALEVIREVVSYQSRQNMAGVDVYMGEVFEAAPNGEITIKKVILGADTSKLTGNSPIDIPDGTKSKMTLAEIMGQASDAEIRAKYPSIDEYVSKLGESNPEIVRQTMDAVKAIEQNAGNSSASDFRNQYPALTNAAESLREAKYLKARGITFKALGAVGALLIAVDCVNMIGEADKAYKAGDTEAGNKIVRDWTLETAGGFATAAAFAEAVAPFALALGTCGGPLGIAGGILLELGAGVVGWMVGSELGHAVSDFIGWLFGEAEGASPPRIDPIIFDLDGDGVETLSVQNGVHFDLDNNGFSEKSGWVGSDDGLLVFDRDGNGTIDAGKE